MQNWLRFWFWSFPGSSCWEVSPVNSCKTWFHLNRSNLKLPCFSYVLFAMFIQNKKWGEAFSRPGRYFLPGCWATTGPWSTPPLMLSVAERYLAGTTGPSRMLPRWYLTGTARPSHILPGRYLDGSTEPSRMIPVSRVYAKLFGKKFSFSFHPLQST
jgi:hypothetical protein